MSHEYMRYLDAVALQPRAEPVRVAAGFAPTARYVAVVQPVSAMPFAPAVRLAPVLVPVRAVPFMPSSGSNGQRLAPDSGPVPASSIRTLVAPSPMPETGSPQPVPTEASPPPSGGPSGGSGGPSGGSGGPSSDGSAPSGGPASDGGADTSSSSGAGGPATGSSWGWLLLLAGAYTMYKGLQR
jgi:hypothetical protein